MRNYVIINGVNSLTIKGLAIKTLPPITKPIQRNLREEIDGRDGDIVTTLGYGAYDKTIEIGLFGTFDIDEVIAYFNQKGTITFSNEADKVYYFQALDQVDYAELLKFRTANVVLHCQPFKYPTEETPLEEEYEYVTGTGTNITINNTSEAIFNKIDLLGNTEQTQYTGYNLLPISSLATQTKNGVTFTNNNDGSYTFNGTASGYTAFSFFDNLSFNGNYTYYLKDTATAGFEMYLQNSNGGGIGSTTSHNTINNNIARMIIGINSGITLSNLTIRPYVYSGNYDSSKTYEPYVGGIPSPNPNYPQDIHVVSGDNTIKIEGRNLFPLNQNTHTSNGIITTYDENGEAHLTGTITNTWANLTNNYTLNLPAGTYTISTTNQLTHTLALKGNYEDGSVAEFAIYSGNRSRTITTTKAVKNGYFYIGGLTCGTTINETITLQVEHGSTRHDYQKYESQSLPLNLGVPNLINETEATLGTISQSDGVTIGSSTSVYYIPSYIDVKPNEAYSFKYNGTSNITIRAFYYNASKTYLSTAVVSGSSSNQVTFTIPTNTYYLRIQYGSGYYNQGLQLTKGDTPQTISTTPLEMVSMPLMNYKDVFVKEEDKWYKRTQIGKFTIGQWASLIGNTTYYQTNFNSTNGIMSFRLPKSQFDNFNLPQSNNIYKGFSDNFTGAGSNLWNNTNQLYKFGYVDGLIFGILYTDIGLDTWTTSARSFETELTNYLGDVAFYLPLKEETDIEITDETLADQLEAIKNAISCKGQTNITQTNNDLPFILDLSALKENSDHLVIDNIGNIYSKPTLDLEGTGIVDIYLNDTQMFEVDLSEKNEIVIDTQAMEAYNPTDNTLANRQVTGDYSKFKLESGENDLRFSGALTKATITNYERWL